MDSYQDNGNDSFHQLGLSEPLLQAIDDVGYEAPTPIQLQVIPFLLAGKDVIGQAQTGTGKTAAFALPILERLEPDRREVQALILTPTRELAIQVAEAIHTYASHLGGVRVAPIYGGQSIQKQIRRLRSGLHIVVGTPGRVMDHLRRGTLDLGAVQTVVLDEADEMLRMGFLEDVEWILSQAPDVIQTALFSATMPKAVQRVADRYLHEPVIVETEHKALTVPSVEQRYMQVAEQQKLDALTRILETEETDAALVFVRTKVGAAELAQKLDARGYAAEAMHGDMNQAQREAVIRQLRSGQAEMVVATDVAARGLDVERISHVINYDIPYDTESYVHRIGRTARAGRSGTAILFVTPRQQRLLRDIERYTGQRIEPMQVPTQADVAARCAAMFKESVMRTLEEEQAELGLYLELVEEIAAESGCDMAEVAAASASPTWPTKANRLWSRSNPRRTWCRNPKTAWCVCSSTPAGVMVWARVILSAPSPMRPTFPASLSALLTSTIALPTWKSRFSIANRCWSGCATRQFVNARPTFVWPQRATRR